MSSLANDVNPELRLPGLRIYDKAFVGGFRAAKLVGVSDDASIYALLATRAIRTGTTSPVRSSR